MIRIETCNRLAFLLLRHLQRWQDHGGVSGRHLRNALLEMAIDLLEPFFPELYFPKKKRNGKHQDIENVARWLVREEGAAVQSHQLPLFNELLFLRNESLALVLLHSLSLWYEEIEEWKDSYEQRLCMHALALCVSEDDPVTVHAIALQHDQKVLLEMAKVRIDAIGTRRRREKDAIYDICYEL